MAAEAGPQPAAAAPGVAAEAEPQPAAAGRGMTILVTGASGFLGGEVCRQLLTRGHTVQSLVRRPGSEPAGTRPVAGDLGDAAALRAALADARPECVVHLAAEIATQRDVRRIREVNIEGTRRLVDACVAAGVRRVVYSCTVVTGDAHGALLTEDSELPFDTVYGRAKHEAERMVRAAPLESVVIRPSHVYGPGGWFAKDMVKRLRAPDRFAVVGRGDNLWDVVRDEDVASALVAALERAPSGSIYHVVDDEPITLYDFAALTARALGVGPPRRLPIALARLFAGRDPIAAVTRSARSSNARVRRELGWVPRFPSAQQGVPDAVARLVAARARR